MSNLTLTIDDRVLKSARIRALEHGTSVNSLVREYLERYAGESQPHPARARLLELSDRMDAGSGAPGRRWRREELYEERRSAR